MSFDPPQHIVSLQNNIRSRPISWEGAVRAKTITEADLKKIKSIDKVRKEQRKQTIEGSPKEYVELFLGSDGGPSIFQAAAKRTDIVHYMLVLLGDIVDDVPSFTSELLKSPNPYKPFLPMLTSSPNLEDPTTPLFTSAVLSSILSLALKESAKPSPQIEEALPSLYSCLAAFTKSTDAGLQDIAVQEYSMVLRTEKSRQLFWKQRAETMGPLFDILKAAVGTSRDGGSSQWNGNGSLRSVETGLSGGVGIQLLYHVLMVMWQLSFEGGVVGEGFQEEHDLINLYVQLLRLSPKEKITRLLLATLNNLLTSNQSSLLPAAILARLPTLLQTIKARLQPGPGREIDPELEKDLNSLIELADEYTKTQTTFDQYAAEVNSGHLRWSPPHRDPNFWRDNSRKILEEEKGALPKKLAEIMAKPWNNDKQVLAIACNDVANLIKEVPEKRAWLEKLGLKGRCLELMQDKEESVRWESLRAVGEWLRYSFDS